MLFQERADSAVVLGLEVSIKSMSSGAGQDCDED